jgi:hypothetical protein
MSSAPDPARWTPAQRDAFMAQRASRNRALGILLFTLVALFFGITVVRMAGQVKNAPDAPAAVQAKP